MAKLKDLKSGKILEVESIGDSASGLLAFRGATPIAQPASSAQEAVVTSVTTTATTTNLKTTMASVLTLLNRLRTDLVSNGLIKGAA